MWNIFSLKASYSFYLLLDLLRNSIYYAPNTFTTVGPSWVTKNLSLDSLGKIQILLLGVGEERKEKK